ncbi:RNase III domain-containing protein [Nemania sp. FL0916]|nr:RNase III domain-containing protein [Nemania sp. FL0916]
MALNTSRSASTLPRQALRHCIAPRASSVANARPLASACARALTTSACRRSEASTIPTEDDERPRWSYTPEAMKAPFSPHITQEPSRSIWHVNENPQKLDEALNSFLGHDGEKMLPEELKWLAVTHKSYDQGRRGFNDRLAFLGRQICIREATESIITSPPHLENMMSDPYSDKRQPFEDPALRSLDNLCETQPNNIFTPAKLTKLAIDTGLAEVVRWKPKMPENPTGSGLHIVMACTVFSLVGAVAMQNGGKAASRIVRERIMRKLRS